MSRRIHSGMTALPRLLAATLLFWGWLPTGAKAAEEGSLSPWTISLRPSFLPGTPPAWAGGVPSPKLLEGSDALLLPVPSLASQEEIGCFALTVVFEDNGDGGPVVEWVTKDGLGSLLSAGLGETGVSVGLNSRTILLPQSLTLDGGGVRISFAGRFSRLLSVSLRPAREVGVAALEGDCKPALITPEAAVLSEREVSGEEAPPIGGDRTKGRLVEAELATRPFRLDSPASSTAEFQVPLSEKPSATLLRAEVAGLDPESWIEVSLNGETRGVLYPSPIGWNDPSVVFPADGRPRIAGWRKASLFLPARLWNGGDNSLSLTLHRAEGDLGTPVTLRAVRCDLLFTATTPSSLTPAASSSPTMSPATTAQTASTPSPTNISSGERLSTGSLYGHPSPALFRGSTPRAPQNP